MDLQVIFERQIKPRILYFEECWIFTGSTKNGTHGNIKVGGRKGPTLYTHRIAFELFHRRLQPGEIVMHKCNTPRCCNPAHLEAGDQPQNMRYAYATGAVGRGAGSGGKSGVAGVYPSEVKGYTYWVARARGGERLYHGADFFEAVCRRKSYENRKEPCNLPN